MAVVSNRMPLRMLSHRLAASRLVRWSSSGKVLNEEEKAAENIYIKKMEQEKLEKLARQGHKPEGEKQSASDGAAGSQSSENVSRDKTKNYAIVASVAAVAAGIWWYTSSKPKEKEQA